MTQHVRHVNKASRFEPNPDTLDKILISGVSGETICGVFKWEKETPRELILDIELIVPLQPAGQSDDLLDTIDYDTLTTEIKTYVQNNHFNLIETVAEGCADRILNQNKIIATTVTVHKPNAMPSAKCLSVSIHRRKQSDV